MLRAIFQVVQTLLRAPLPTRYAVSRKLDPTCASLKMSTFVDAVMTHLLTLPAAPTDMTLEVQVNALVGNDERRTGIALKNTAALKVEKQELY